MAASSLPMPGTEYGPCVDECGHRDCMATRGMSIAMRTYCEELIGYERRFYAVEDGQFAHAVCHEEAILSGNAR